MGIKQKAFHLNPRGFILQNAYRLQYQPCSHWLLTYSSIMLFPVFIPPFQFHFLSLSLFFHSAASQLHTGLVLVTFHSCDAGVEAALCWLMLSLHNKAPVNTPISKDCSYFCPSFLSLTSNFPIFFSFFFSFLLMLLLCLSVLSAVILFHISWRPTAFSA